ncbi:MAG: hypothetical protein Q7S21_02490 [archaeon]|nr:hypothetical protein [archaeon]
MVFFKKLFRRPKKSLKKKFEERGIKFKHDDILVPSMDLRDRNLKTYLTIFNLAEEDLIGKKVLDVGTGVGNFVYEARKKGINAIGIDPAIGDQTSFLKRITAQEINYNKEFDIIFSCVSIPSYLKTAHNTRLSIFNMVNALKVNGQLLIFPVDIFTSKKSGLQIYRVATQTWPFRALNLNTLMKKLKKCGFRCEENNRVLQIKRTKFSNIKKLQELLGLAD